MIDDDGQTGSRWVGIAGDMGLAMTDEHNEVLELQGFTTLSTCSPPTFSIEDLDELTAEVRDAVRTAVQAACGVNGIPFDNVISATFRQGRVAEAVVRLD